jgi:chromate transport protein ChrA
VVVLVVVVMLFNHKGQQELVRQVLLTLEVVEVVVVVDFTEETVALELLWSDTSIKTKVMNGTLGKNR